MKKVVILALSAVMGIVIGARITCNKILEKQNQEKKMSDKHLKLFLMMNQWVRVKQEGKNLSEYFKEETYKRIAIYGMSYAGETLINELKNTEIEVVYGIDKNADYIYSDMDVFYVDDDLEKVDAVVVTSISFFEEIKEQLSGKLDCPILSMEDILYEI